VDDTITSPGERRGSMPAEADLSEGSVIGSFRILKKLGEGGMGTVYAAERDGRRCAIKILRRELSVKAAHRERFRREAIAAQRVKHDGVVEVLGCEHTEDDRIIIAFELVEGPTLGERLRSGPLPLGDALHIARRIASALDAIHRAGIIHRDLKPSNILLSESTGAKIADFGVCKLEEEERLTVSGFVVGTPAYMSPEHVQNGARADARSDVYSLGMMLYEMFTGAPPFLGEPLSILFQHVHKTPAPLPASIPIEISALVEKAIAKDPNARFQSMKEFAAVLAYTAVELGLGAIARENTRPHRRRRKRQREAV
jgi:serine/threonine-protein kinase